MAEKKIANAERGEVEIALDGKTFVLRPTFGAIAEIESRTGSGIIELTQRACRGDIKMMEAAAIIKAGLTAYGEPAIYEKVGDMVFKTGLQSLSAAIIAYLGQAITGGRSAVDGAEAGEEKATGAAADTPSVA